MWAVSRRCQRRGVPPTHIPSGPFPSTLRKRGNVRAPRNKVFGALGGDGQGASSLESTKTCELRETLRSLSENHLRFLAGPPGWPGCLRSGPRTPGGRQPLLSPPLPPPPSARGTSSPASAGQPRLSPQWPRHVPPAAVPGGRRPHTLAVPPAEPSGAESALSRWLYLLCP